MQPHMGKEGYQRDGLAEIHAGGDKGEIINKSLHATGRQISLKKEHYHIQNDNDPIHDWK